MLPLGGDFGSMAIGAMHLVMQGNVIFLVVERHVFPVMMNG
jgi:hypothetical protein